MIQKAFTYFILFISLLSSCKQQDKSATTDNTVGQANVIIDSTTLKSQNTQTTSAGNPFVSNQPASSPIVVTQQNKVQASSQNVQITPEQMQQMQQQALQAQQQQMQQNSGAQQPQQIQANQQAAHPQFSVAEFKKMQDDAKKRGVQLNPAHGQPGHRCDIYVGQPLDSKPVPSLQQKPTTATTTAPQTVTVAPQPVKTEPGMNPPHGQPGHRCDIGVGAPLNSKPAAPATTPQVIKAEPAKADSSKN
ncbi:MAG: hypothetical protein IPP48_00585 [Chitinophagaceae bacterium]|nr:hypothetical protein [Chitinophagaceae bacterium]